MIPRSLRLVVTVLGCACGGLFPTTLPALQLHGDSLQRRPVTYANGSVTISATLLLPANATPVPGVVIAHGSGSSTRENPWTSAYAEALVRRGVAVLYPDKRGSGESTGDWRASSVDDLAGDATAGLRFLRAQSGVDSTAVGVLGFSQGGYVAAAAASDPAVAFMVVVSGGTASLREQIVDELVLEAEHRDEPLSTEELDHLGELYRRLFDVTQRLDTWATYERAVADAQALGGPLSHAVRTMPRDSTHWVIGYLRHMGNFDPMAHWDDIDKPVLFIYGGQDTQVRVDASIARLRAAPSRDHFTLVTLGGNGHALFRDDVMAFLVEWVQIRGGKR